MQVKNAVRKPVRGGGAKNSRFFWPFGFERSGRGKRLLARTSRRSSLPCTASNTHQTRAPPLALTEYKTPLSRAQGLRR